MTVIPTDKGKEQYKSIEERWHGMLSNEILVMRETVAKEKTTLQELETKLGKFYEPSIEDCLRMFVKRGYLKFV